LFNGLHYNSITSVLKSTFGRRIVKLSIDGHFTCPNRDGKVGFGGCSFCSSKGSGEHASSTKEQLVKQIENLKRKYTDEVSYIAYFQSHTNTYAPKEQLQTLFEDALNIENVVGLAIATRPDCLGEDILDLLEELNKKTYLWVELGFQTANENTAKSFNRCYDNGCFEEAMNNLSRRGIKSVVHLVLGLPGESKEDFIRTAKYIAKLKPFGVKIHMLNILKDSKYGEEYQENKQLFPLLSEEEYVQNVCDILEILPDDITIHRLTGDGDKDKLLAPLWVTDKHKVLNDIQKEFSRRNSFQGIKAAK